MARLSMKHMRENVKAKTPGTGGSDIWTPMGDLDVGDTAVVRLIPYEDELTGGFWTAQKYITLSFVNPDNDDEEWTYRVPSLEMYELPSTSRCPVANEARSLFKEAEELKQSGSTDEAKTIEIVALKHWIRYSYLFQGFVLKGGKTQRDPNELVPMKFPKSMYNGIHTSVMDPDSGLDSLPTGEFDLEAIQILAAGEMPDDMDEDEFANMFVGRNYVVRKTKKDQYNNYETSSWEMKESDLTDEQVDYIAEHGLIDLTKFLPKRPTEEQYEVMTEMAKVSIDRALGNDDGYWNPEWEEFGIKPNKPRSDDSGSTSGDNKKGSLKDRVRNRKKNNESDESPKTSARKSLNKSRGVKKDESEPDTSESDDTPESDAPNTVSTGGSDRMAKMKARLAAKKKAAAEA